MRFRPAAGGGQAACWAASLAMAVAWRPLPVLVPAPVRVVSRRFWLGISRTRPGFPAPRWWPRGRSDAWPRPLVRPVLGPDRARGGPAFGPDRRRVCARFVALGGAVLARRGRQRGVLGRRAFARPLTSRLGAGRGEGAQVRWVPRSGCRWPERREPRRTAGESARVEVSEARSQE